MIDVNLKGTFLVTQVGYQAHALVLFKCFKIADSRQHCSEDWEHWSGQLYSRQQLVGDEEHSGGGGGRGGPAKARARAERAEAWREKKKVEKARERRKAEEKKMKQLEEENARLR